MHISRCNSRVAVLFGQGLEWQTPLSRSVSAKTLFFFGKDVGEDDDGDGDGGDGDDGDDDDYYNGNDATPDDVRRRRWKKVSPLPRSSP